MMLNELAKQSRERSQVLESGKIHAVLAATAYEDPTLAKPIYKSMGFTGLKFFEHDGAQAYAVWNKEHIVLCFRGTEPTEISDLKADLNAWPDRGEVGGLVHNGFQNEVEKIWKDVLKTIDSKSHASKKLTMCGHSLGGAMATVAASRQKDRIDSLYTFGSPRVGNKEFVNAFSDVKHYRFVNNNDIVPTVPFAWMGYRHHGECMYFNYKGYLKKFTYWEDFIDGWKGKWRALQKGQVFDGLYDHGANYYCLYTASNYDQEKVTKG
jgi:triacylglycerol lipase